MCLGFFGCFWQDGKSHPCHSYLEWKQKSYRSLIRDQSPTTVILTKRPELGTYRIASSKNVVSGRFSGCLWSAVLSVTFNPSSSIETCINTISLCTYWLKEGGNRRVQSELLFNVEFIHFLKTKNNSLTRFFEVVILT